MSQSTSERHSASHAVISALLPRRDKAIVEERKYGESHSQRAHLAQVEAEVRRAFEGLGSPGRHRNTEELPRWIESAKVGTCPLCPAPDPLVP